MGPDYDDALKVYTTITGKDVFKIRPVGTILQSRDAVADFTPLKKLIGRLFGKAELEAIAQEHASGRMLYIGTTHLDAQQPVFWDMGAIAASGHPEALEIFQKVMLASATVPIAVPPVYFEVEADGNLYEEMHVDGGITTQVFGAKLLRLAADAWQEAGYTVTARLYLIRNAHLSPEYEKVKSKISAIGGRTISTLIKVQGFGDIYRAYVDAIDSGNRFQLFEHTL